MYNLFHIIIKIVNVNLNAEIKYLITCIYFYNRLTCETKLSKMLILLKCFFVDYDVPLALCTNDMSFCQK